MISGCLTLLFMIGGFVLWGGAVLTFCFEQEIALSDLFCLVLGGQMIKFAYAICESGDIDSKDKAIIDAIKDK